MFSLSGCKIICGAPMTLAVKGMMMMMTLSLHLLWNWTSKYFFFYTIINVKKKKVCMQKGELAHKAYMAVTHIMMN